MAGTSALERFVWFLEVFVSLLVEVSALKIYFDIQVLFLYIWNRDYVNFYLALLFHEESGANCIMYMSTSP
jgi:hypothetical protein